MEERAEGLPEGAAEQPPEKVEAAPAEVKAEAVPEKLMRPRTPSGEAPEVKEGKSEKPASHEQKTERKDNKVISNAKWQNLQNLQNLLNAGFITKTEYKDRKSQLIDELTGTTISTVTMTAGGRRPSTEITVVPKAPPDFSTLVPENATKHVYDLAARKWTTSKVRIKLDTVPFAKGGLRLVYHMQELDCEDDCTYVAKLSMDANDRDDRDIYFRDVEMQSVAKYYAKLFNEYNPPKNVDFVKAWILQLDDREGSPICGVERFIDGPYRKHNNNYGFVSDEERNTPQSFSHFSYESSNHGLLVCDIQGVSDLYTDPQVHSADGQSFGKGNLGQRGIDRFIQSHRCNAICRYLKLPSINANYAGMGTLPVTQYMKHTRVEVVHIGSFPRIERPATPTPPNADLSRPLLEEPPPPQHEDTCCSCTLL